MNIIFLVVAKPVLSVQLRIQSWPVVSAFVHVDEKNSFVFKLYACFV